MSGRSDKPEVPVSPEAVRIRVEGGPAIVLEPRREGGHGTGVLLDGVPLEVELTNVGGPRRRLRVGGEPSRDVLVTPARGSSPTGPARRWEVVVDGWRFEVATESEVHARLRARATRGSGAGSADARVELRAIIPGRIVSVAVAAGDHVDAGQSLLIVEAMKMQNELRAPRAGQIGRVAVAPDQTVERGDVLVVLE